MKRILVIGALGQIGSELTAAFNRRYGTANVVAADVNEDTRGLFPDNAFERLDVTDAEALEGVVLRRRIDTIVNLAALLSATGEKNPDLAWHININGLLNVIRLAIKHRLDRVMTPSSIAVFGPQSVLYDTPQETVLTPNTMYGVTKVVGELLGDYYFKKAGLDFRGIRYPGIISNQTMPGGGTTDYAVEIFYAAVRDRHYTCFLSNESCLPMMYMPDCIRATIALLEADRSRLRHHGNYNVGAMSFTPEILTREIQKHIPDFTIDYRPDFRREIARYWPASVDDSAARSDWGWQPEWTLETMVDDMLRAVRAKTPPFGK